MMTKLILLIIIAAIVIVGVIFVMAKLLRGTKDRNKYITAAVLLLIIFFIVVLPSIWVTQILSVVAVYEYAVERFQFIGVPLWFARAIVVALILPFIWAVGRVLLPWQKAKPVHYTVAGAYICGYCLIMGIGTESHIEGKFYGLSEDGTSYEIWDRPGLNPYWGDSLRPLTPEVKRMIQRQKQMRFDSNDLENALVHPRTGIPLKYYTIDDQGIVHVHDEPGFDSRTGEPKFEFTREILDVYVRQQDSLVLVARADSIRLQHERDSLRAVQAREHEESQTRATVQRLRNTYLKDRDFKGFGVTEATVYVYIQNASALTTNVEKIMSRMKQVMEQERYVVRNFPFTDKFVEDGHLRDLILGNNAELRNMGVTDRKGVVLVLTVENEDTPVIGGRIVREVSCRLQLVSLDGIQLVEQLINAKGIGADEVISASQLSNDLISKIRLEF